MRRSFFSSSIRLTLVCSRPAVSTSTRSAPRSCAALIASNTTEPGSAPSWPRTISAPVRSAQVRELLGGRGAERVGRGEHDAPALVDLALRELGDARGLPDAVHADEHPDARLRRRRGAARGRRRPSSVTSSSRSSASTSLGVAGLLGLGPLADVLEDLRGRRHADVGEDQRLFEVVPRLVVDLAPPGDAGERAGERGAGLAQPVAQARLDPLDRVRRPRARASTSGASVGGAVGGARRARRAADTGRVGAGRRRRLGQALVGAGRAARQEEPAADQDDRERDDDEDDHEFHRGGRLGRVAPTSGSRQLGVGVVVTVGDVARRAGGRRRRGR